MEIGSRSGYPASVLSNFNPNAFIFDGVECASMEGLVQAFKFKEIELQIEVCALVGFAAKNRGQERNDAWKSVQKLWWKGQEFDRHGVEYQILLDRAFDALSKNEIFRKALLATGNEVLTHSIGNPNANDTVLTEEELCSRLTRIRDRPQS